jgi:RHS repeat-associated protein
VPVSLNRSGVTYYLFYDQIGSLRAVIDASGAVTKELLYDSHGSIIYESNTAFTVPFGFAGGLNDEDTDLVRFGFRDYDPAIGRWSAKDPIDFAGGDGNLFGYVGNNPVNWIDAIGLSGTLTICSNGANDGASGSGGMSGHSWIIYTPDGSSIATTYGTWGNDPAGMGNGLHTNLEQGRQCDTSRSSHVDNNQETNLYNLLHNSLNQGESGWGYFSPCSSFASNAWNTTTGESLNPYGPYSNPSTLGNSIINANGGVSSGVLH